MLIELGDLSNGMGKIFMREFMQTANPMCCDKGHILFREGEATHHFYTLIQGKILLTIGTNEQNVYEVRHPGDIFGWSSLVGGNTYSATAICLRLSEILRFDRDKLVDLLGMYPDCGLVFFKKLAETLGRRLLESYRILHGDKVLGCCEPETIIRS